MIVNVVALEPASLWRFIRRPSIQPEKLLRAMLLQAFYSIRSEQLLMAAGTRPDVPLVCRNRL